MFGFSFESKNPGAVKMAQLAKLLATKFDDLTLILGTRWRKERMDSRELSPDRHVVPWMVVTTRRERRECTHALKKCNNKKINK